MASLLSSEAKRLYSWWWDSHNSPKNSKWLHENLSDMDDKVKAMIKLIEEDADSFARKAEMYYKKRPELMKLVEEFYRAYRALAERYDHATGELRHAHRTMAKSLPDKVPFELVEDSSSGSSAQEKGPHMLELNRTVRALLDADELVLNTLGHSSVDIHTAKTIDLSNLNMEGGLRWYGLKELPDIFGAKETVAEISKSSDRKGANQEQDRAESLDDEVLLLSTENLNLKYKILHEIERAGKAENEVQGLRKTLADVGGEKEETLLQYQQCLHKLSKLEEQLNNAQKDSMRFSERAGQAESEIQTLKEALIQLEGEKNVGLVKQKEYFEKISHLEAMGSQLQNDMKGAESQAQTLEDKASRLELEKEEVVRQYNQCLSKISYLENIILVMEDEARVLKNQAERAEAEVSELNKALADANMEKEALAQRYKHCLEIVSKLEKDLTDANDNVQCLNNEVLVGNAKLKTAEGKCNLLELSNQTLQVEADNLTKHIVEKNQELLKKQEELEKLQICLQDENVRHKQVEATLQALQDLYSQSQDDQRALTLEFKNVLQMLKDVEVSKTVLEEDNQQVRDENHHLNQANLSSAVSMEGMQSEILSLREIKERLEKEVSRHVCISISLKKEIFCLKEEIDDLKGSYQAIVEQVEAAGLNSKCVVASVKSLQDENSRLREMCEQDRNEKAILSKKLENMEDVLKKAVVVESSLSDLNAELESSCKKVTTLQETCQDLLGEKASLVDEKASLLSQLQVITENMHNLLEKNAILENSLSTARVELEGLREKSKGLEEICELLKDERSYLLTERDALVSKLENAEGKHERMEKRYMVLEEKYANLQKEKESMHCQVDKLEISLGIEKQERMSSQVLSESRLAGLENQIYLLQEENRWKKKESEEELDKALKAQFELSILQKFMKDMEEKNCSLIIECQKHVEASKLAERVISKLESESLEQQVESEVLLDEIERLRLGIYQIFQSLETGPDYAPVNKIENEQAFIHHIFECIEDMKCLISEHEDDKQQLLVENSVLLALLEQLKSNGMDILSQKLNMEQEFNIMAFEFAIVNNDKEKLQDLNRQLKSDASMGRQHVAILKSELASLFSKQVDLQKKYETLMADYSQVDRENTCLLKKFSESEGEKCQVIQLNDTALQEIFQTATQSEVLRGFGAEKVSEIKLLIGDLIRQSEVNSRLEKELKLLREKLKLQNAESLVLQDAIHSLEEELQEMTEINVQMDRDMKNGKEKLIQTEAELLDTEMKLAAVEKLNSSLSRTVAELKRDARQSIEIRENLQDNIAKLSEDNSSQKEDIKYLQRAKKNLESDLGLLHQEIEENTLGELNLNTELQEMNNEFEDWKAEASTFCFDLQVASVQEVLLKNKVEKNKVEELTAVCKTLENVCAAKTLELEEMKGKVCSSENEISGLKSQLNTYGSTIASLRDDLMLLERNLLLQADFKAAQGQEPEFSGIAAYANEDSFQMLPQDQCLLSLKELQIRVKAVRELMEGTKRPHSRTRLRSGRKEEPAVGEPDHQLRPHRSFSRHKHERSRRRRQANGLYDYPKVQGMKSKVSEGRSGMLMKDIPLDEVSDNPRQGMSRRGCVELDDQMFELRQTAESGNKIGESHRTAYKRDMECDLFENFNEAGVDPPTESDMERELESDYNKLYLPTLKAKPDREVGDEKILNRLTSNGQRLDLLQTVVDNLRTTWESSKKSKKAKKSDSQAIHEQLLEAEDSLVQLIDLNGQLVNHIELCPHDEAASPRLKETVNTWRMKVLEQAEKGSERINRLHFELQRVQYNLMKLGDNDERKVLKGRNRFFILRDFAYIGRKNSRRRKKDPKRAWFRQSIRPGED